MTAVRPKRLVDADALVLPGVNPRGERWRADWLLTAAGVLREANHWQGTMLCEAAASALGKQAFTRAAHSQHSLATDGGRLFLAHLLALNPSTETLNAVVKLLREPAS